MNTILEELAKQADMYARYDYKYPEDLSEDYHMIFERRFAELIIEKCIGEVALVGISNFDNDDIVWATSTGIDNIKRRFGVI